MCLSKPKLPPIPDVRALPPAPPPTPSALVLERPEAIEDARELQPGEQGEGGFGISQLLIPGQLPR